MKQTPECSLFVERLNGVLDGERTQDSLIADEHLTACAACQLRYAAAAQIAAYRPKPSAVPAGFAHLTLARVQGIERRQQLQRWRQRILGGVGAAVAASLMLAIWMNATAPRTENPMVELAPALPSPPAGVVKPLNEARDAIVSLSTTVASESIAPAKNLYAATTSAKPAASVVDSDPLGDFPDAAKAGLESLVNSPRRALNLFLRDVGGIAGTRKANS